MLDFVYDISTVVQGVLIVGAMVALSLAGLVLTRGLADPDIGRAYNDVLGFTYGTVGVLYAVLLAFAAVMVWQDTDKAAEILHREENAIADLYDGVDLLPAEFSNRVRDNARAYVAALVEDEWPQMQRGKSSAKATKVLEVLFADFGAFEPATKREEAVYAEAFHELKQAFDSRRMRLFAAANGLKPVVWCVLISGAAIAIAFTYLFALRSTIIQGIMTSALSASIGLIFFLIVALDYPFRGDVAIPADRLRALLTAWQAQGI
jgi:hypothetical protein